MADIQYINYGNQLIDQLVLLLNMANEVTNYVSNQPWSSKRKLKFMDAYTNLITHGILGASNDTGVWTVNVGGDTIPLETMSKKDLEMYKEAAYFIQLQMSKLPTAESKKSDLPVFDNAYFTKNFANYVSTQLFGGRPFDTKTDWNSLDKRGDNGLRDRTNRSKILSDLLGRYADSLNENELSFEGSPFTDLNDFKSRVERAKAALATTDNIDDDTEALNALGLRASDWFNDGSGDASTTINPETGEPLTYGLLNAYNDLLAQQKNNTTNKLPKKENILQLNPLVFTTLKANFVGKTQLELKEKYGDQNSLINALNEYSYSNLLNSDLKRDIFGAMRMALNPISDELYNELMKTPTYKGSAKNRFKVINGVDNYIYDTKTGNIILISNRENLASPEATADLFAGIETSKEQLERRKKTTIGENNGLTDDMKADLAAMGLDLTSAGLAFVPGYGTIASAATGIGATISGAAADRMRGESWGSTLGTAGFGLLMDTVGLIPGIGVAGKAAKIAKVVSKAAKWIGPALLLYAGLSYGPGAISAFNKFTSGKTSDITAEEYRDFTYAIRAIAAGGIRKAGSTVTNNREIARARVTEIKSGKNKGKKIAELTTEKQPASITTKNGKTVSLSNEELKTLKSNASREEKVKLLKSKGIEENEIEWKGINPAKLRFKTEVKSNKIRGLDESVESSRLKWNTTAEDYLGIRRFSNLNILRNYTTMSGFNSGIFRGVRNWWTGQDILNGLVPKSTTTSSGNTIKGYLPLPKTNTTVKSASTTKPLNNSVITPKSTSTDEVIFPTSSNLRALPAPGQTGNTINSTKVGARPTNNFSTRENLLEVSNWISSYNLDSRRSKSSAKGGYKNSSNTPSGTLNDTFAGKKITFDKDMFGNITIEIDGVKSKPYKSLLSARQYMAKQLYDLYKSKGINYTELGNKLRNYKLLGILKLGGRIDKQKIQKYKEFINK